MTDFRPIFTQLGLQEYIERFTEEGFDSWETVLEITESDLDILKVKLGHRRIIQREIASARGARIEQLSAYNSTSTSHASFEPKQVPVEDGDENYGSEPKSVPRQKRRYRRHPKPDENAPERPPSAYVVFSNKIREELKPKVLSFTEIAKRVGESWQVLDSAEKEPFETLASTAKERYYREMATYKTTDTYREYQRYLADFKAKHGNQAGEIYSRLGPEQSTPSSASACSATEGPGFPFDTNDPTRRKVDTASTNAPFLHPDSHYLQGRAPSTTSSIPTSLSPTKDSSSISPQAPPRFASSSPKRRAAFVETYQERSLPHGPGQQNVASHSAYEAMSPSSANSTSASQDARYPQARKTPLRPPEQLPSFRQQSSSASSITSSHSSISTAATSCSTPRGVTEDDAKPYVTLPPLSAVTGISRDEPPSDQSKDLPASFVPEPRSYSVRQPLPPASPKTRDPMRDQQPPRDHSYHHRADERRPKSTQPRPLRSSMYGHPRTQASEANPRHDALSVLADVANAGPEFHQNHGR